MKQEEVKTEVIRYWMEKAYESLESAKSEQKAGRFSFAINRTYYACFYSASSVLMGLGKSFHKHTGVRSGIHRSLVKTGMINASQGKFYDLLFDSRQRGDYQELVEFSEEQVQEAILQAQEFVNVMSKLLKEMSSESNHFNFL
ncbi:MAG: HEPN domain-containing protein [Desulfobacterales bacterium]